MPNDGGDRNLYAQNRLRRRERLDRDQLTLVASGGDEHCSWELHDGPYPVAYDPQAVASAFSVTPSDESDEHPWWMGEIGRALEPGNVASLSSEASAEGQILHGHIWARCRADVAAARVHFDVGSTELLPAATSTTTGQGWVVLALHSPPSPDHIDFLDNHGVVIATQNVKDPRRTEPLQPPQERG